MPLTGSQREALTRALAAAFPTNADLELLVEFKLGVHLNEITPSATQAVSILHVITWAAARGQKLTDLIVGAQNMNPDNPDLLGVAADFGIDEGAGDFEAIVQQQVQFADPEAWRKDMMACERSVCRIDINESANGTGFLIGTRLVITNYHVVQPAIKEPTALSVLFDFKRKADGKTVQSGVRYKLAPSAQWLAASSPEAELDYAVLRTTGKPGAESVASQPGAPERGFLTPRAYHFKKGEPLFIIQHPSGSPLKFAPGSVDNTNVARNRVAYTVNTEPGSSGSPCFTSDWTPVALHHWGGSQHNRGVKFSAILSSWQANGIAGEVGK